MPVGVDDVLAILLALSASPEDLEVVMLSVTYGNVPLQGYVDYYIRPFFFFFFSFLFQ